MLRRQAPLRVGRRIVQVLLFGLFLYIIWTTQYPLRGFINPGFLFQLDPLVMGITALAERLWLPGLLWALATLAVTFVFGRVFCGWFCPLGTLQDLVARLASPWRKNREREPGRGRFLKYFLLGGLALLAAAGLQLAWLFDPLAVFVRAFSFNVHPAVNRLVDRAFAVLLQSTDFYAPLAGLYQWLQEHFLDISHPVFPHASIILVMLVLLLAAALLRRRFWCRYLCPLGALLGLVSKFARLRRVSEACPANCAVCRDLCRVNAIRADQSTLSAECVMCFDCVADCPGGRSAFTFSGPPRARAARDPEAPGRLTRAQFLRWLAGVLGLFTLGARRTAAGTPAVRPVLRPPGALPEREFVQRCVRCGNCMKVCLTNVLQPAAWESGAEGVWTPRLATELSYCEYQCTLCGQVCPTGAIERLRLQEKLRTKMGLAVIDRSLCLPWSTGQECIVCEEHCPVSHKAIKVERRPNRLGQPVRVPAVDPQLCVGCGICEVKCPVSPKAIRVRPL